MSCRCSRIRPFRVFALVQWEMQTKLTVQIAKRLDPSRERDRALALVASRILEPFLQARYQPLSAPGDVSSQPGRVAAVGRAQRGRSIRGHGLAGRTSAADRSDLRPAPSSAGRVGAVQFNFQAVSRATIVRWRSMATRAMSVAATRRSSLASCPRRKAVRLEWKSSRATPATPRP